MGSATAVDTASTVMLEDTPGKTQSWQKTSGLLEKSRKMLMSLLIQIYTKYFELSFDNQHEHLRTKLYET